jgi:hypothetical protein
MHNNIIFLLFSVEEKLGISFMEEYGLREFENKVLKNTAGGNNRGEVKIS